MMNGRRSFLKGFGLLGVVVAGASASHAAANLVSESTSGVLPSNVNPVHEPVVESAPDITHLAPPSNATTLQINGSYGEPPKPVAPVSNWGESIYSFAPINRTVTNSVAMTVGKDNRLWMKVDDKWRRVALEE